MCGAHFSNTIYSLYLGIVPLILNPCQWPTCCCFVQVGWRSCRTDVWTRMTAVGWARGWWITNVLPTSSGSSLKKGVVGSRYELRVDGAESTSSIKFMLVNTLRQWQNGCQFPDDIFKCIFLIKNIWISIKISLKFIPKGPIDNIPALIQIMAWHQPGDQPYQNHWWYRLVMHICISRPQCVNLSLGKLPLICIVCKKLFDLVAKVIKHNYYVTGFCGIP